MKRVVKKVFSVFGALLCTGIFFSGFIEEKNKPHEPNQQAKESQDNSNLIQQVLELSSDQKHEKAIDVLVETIKDKPEQEDIFRSLLTSTFDIFLQEQEAQNIKSEDQDNVVAYKKIADSLEALGNNEQAMEVLLQAIKKNQKDVSIWLDVADLELKANRKNEALDIFKEVLRLDKNNTQAIEGIAQIVSENSSTTKKLTQSIKDK